MSVKNMQAVECHVIRVAQIRKSIDTLNKLVAQLPTPDENGELPSPYDYGHLGKIEQLHAMLGTAEEIAERFWN